MVQKDRVILMTKYAIEEKHDTRQTFIMEDFWFNDYLTTEMWKAFLALTAVYALVVLLGLVAFSDGWSYTYHIADAIALGKKLLTGWVLTSVFGVLLCVECHVYYYIKAYRKRQRSQLYLRQLNRLYQAEERKKKRENAT